MKIVKSRGLFNNKVKATIRIKVLMESFHLSSHTFRYRLDSSGFRSFLGLVKFGFGNERIRQCYVRSIIGWGAFLC